MARATLISARATNEPGVDALGRFASPPLDDAWSGTVDRRSLEILAQRRTRAFGRRRGSIIRRGLAMADLVGLVVAFLAAQAVFASSSTAADRLDLLEETLLFAATLPAWIVFAKLHGLYARDEERTDHSTVDDLIGVLHLVTIGAWVFVAASWITGLADPNFPKVLTFWALAIAFVTLGRAAARGLCRRSARYVQNTVVVGNGEIGTTIARKLQQHPEYGLNFVGFVDGEKRASAQAVGHGPLADRLLGQPDDLYAIVYLYDVERIIVAHPETPDEDTLGLLRSLRDLPVQVDVVPRFHELVSPNVELHTVEGLPLVGLRPFRLSRAARLAKRAMDVAGSFMTLLVLAPLLLSIALAVRLDSDGPVIFRQTRMGAGGRPFSMLKLRTMVVDAEARKDEVAHLNKHQREGGARMFKVPNDPRITTVGRFLRRYSLDELPQLLNVLRGEMSLVGPRPLVLDEDSQVEAWGRRRLTFTPGITGPWQVLGRTHIPFEEMIRLDYLYVTEWSLYNDLKWLLRTIPAVLRPSDAY